MARTQTQRHDGNRKRDYGLVAWIMAALLCLLPGYTLWRAAARIPATYIVAYLIVISLVTLAVYWSDKRKATRGAWRTPESTLHILEFAGGWPAAFLAQHLFRHKTAKTQYQLIFWAIAILHQCLATAALYWRLPSP